MSETSFGSWSAPESPVAIEYSLVVIEEIRQEVSEGFQRLSRGGMEVGGLLYGSRDGRTVKIQAMRPIACEHARGPAFLLSDQDRAALAEQLQRDAEDPRLEGLMCVGWFLSHTRSEILLSESDQGIYTAFFSAPWQVTLVIRPGRGGSMRAGFFVREADGTVKSERSYLEFNFPDRLAGVLDRGPRTERQQGERRGGPFARTESSAAMAPFPRESPQMYPSASGGPELMLPSAPERKKWPLIVVAVVLLLLAGWGARVFLLAPRVDPIGLLVLDHDGQLQIQWNHNSRTVVAASRGNLDITDGKSVRHIPLTDQDLARGSFTYQRSTGDVGVRMTVEDSQGHKNEEPSQYLGSPPAKVSSAEIQDLEQQRDTLKAEVDRLTEVNNTQNDRIMELERTNRVLQSRLGIK
jgi:hypothetical protein